jgi:SOS-response transcriptional repressor LexA
MIYEGARRDGFQPGYAEICAKFGIKTKCGAGCHIKALGRKRYLGISKSGDARSLRLLVRPDGMPFRGFVDDPPLHPYIDDRVTPQEMPTEGQRDLFMFLYSRARLLGFQPSIVEIVVHFGVTSPHGIHGKLVILCRKGWLAQTGHGRGVRFLRRPDGLPFRGFADAPAVEGGVA